jgi:ADP-heptose:LPS heptosyltransferase
VSTPASSSPAQAASIFVFTQYCPTSIGEQVVQVPFFHFLREQNPDARIVAVVPEQSEHVIAELGLADSIVTYPIDARSTRLYRLVRELRSYDCRLVFQHRRKSIRAAVLARLSTSAPVVGFEGPADFLFQKRSHVFDRERYIAESYVDMLGRHVQDFANAFDRGGDGYVLIIPAGRTDLKRYPLDRYVEIARVLSSLRPVGFLLGPDMEAERNRLRSEPDGYAVHFGLDLREVENIVRKASLVIANDCGPAHFAHIYDVPRISIFDRSIAAAHWFFAGRHGRLIRSPEAGGIHLIPPDAILEQARELLPEDARPSDPGHSRRPS